MSNPADTAEPRQLLVLYLKSSVSTCFMVKRAARWLISRNFWGYSLPGRGGRALFLSLFTFVAITRGEPSSSTVQDDDWPWGRSFFSPVTRTREGTTARVCSFHRPLCIHEKPGQAASARALATLEEAERAYDVLRLRLGFPSPVADEQAGGSAAFDLYLADLPTGKTYEVGFDVSRTSPYDRASTFGRLDASLPDGCERRTAIHRLLALASLAALDAGETGGFFASSAAYLAMESTGCLGPVLGSIDNAQAMPQTSQIPVTTPDDPLASPLFLWYLDGAFGAEAPGTLLASLWHLGVQTTPPNADRFHNQPDLFATLTSIARGKKSTLPDVLIDAAVARAFLGDRDDDQHLRGSRPLGAFGRVRFDASYGYSTLPRRLAFTPLDPTGTVYVWVDLRGAPAGARIGLQASWEKPVTMRWTAVRVDGAGRERSRIDVAWEPNVQSVQRRILELENLAGLLVVGVNVGEVGPGHPFRADEAPYEPHGGTLLLMADAS